MAFTVHINVLSLVLGDHTGEQYSTCGRTSVIYALFLVSLLQPCIDRLNKFRVLVALDDTSIT